MPFDFFQVPIAPHGCAGEEGPFAAGIIDDTSVEGSLENARRDRVHSDIILRPLCSEAACDLRNSAFAGAIRRCLMYAHERGRTRQRKNWTGRLQRSRQCLRPGRDPALRDPVGGTTSPDLGQLFAGGVLRQQVRDPIPDAAAQGRWPGDGRRF